MNQPIYTNENPTNDYITFVKYRNSLETLAYKLQQQWLPYIKKYAYTCIWKDVSLDVEDFIAEAYFNLLYYCKNIQISKVNKRKFSFFLFVKYACCRTKMTLFMHTLPCSHYEDYIDIYTDNCKEESTIVGSLFVKNLLDNLSEKEQDIVKRRIGLEDNHSESLESIGKIHNGISRERVRQIEKKACLKLRKYL